MLKAGTAEVLYTSREDALQACKKYHNRELDGLPMQVCSYMNGELNNATFTLAICKLKLAAIYGSP